MFQSDPFRRKGSGLRKQKMNDPILTDAVTIACKLAVDEAIRLLNIYTAGSYDFFVLSGSARASCRAHIMSVLCGRHVPQKESGIFALRQEFYTKLGIAGNCEAVRSRNFRSLCKSALCKSIEESK